MSLDKGGRSNRDIVHPLKFTGIYLRWPDLLSLKNYAVQKYFIQPRGVCVISKLFCVNISWINAVYKEKKILIFCLGFICEPWNSYIDVISLWLHPADTFR